MVDYEWVKEALESGRTDTLLLDVRNRPERREPGYIPGSRNVPRKEHVYNTM